MAGRPAVRERDEGFRNRTPRRDQRGRIALGASAREVTHTLLVRGLALVGLGLAEGVAGTLAAGGVLRRLLFRVEPSDPVTIVSVALMLVAVAVVATLISARRATRLDPAHVLSSE